MYPSFSQMDLDKLATYTYNTLELKPQASMDEANLYHNLPLCITDAVFSINAKYAGVRNVTRRLAKFTKYSYLLGEVGEESTLINFIAYFDMLGVERMTQEVFQNRQRTSTRNGILKTDAVEQFTRVLIKNGVNQRKDMETANHEAIKADITRIPGQRSGLSLRYFYMLLGDTNFVKPDRHIKSFIYAAIGSHLDDTTCHDVLVATCYQLQTEFPHLTPRALDARIWQHYQHTPNMATLSA
jgi:hypothetical protein